VQIGGPTGAFIVVVAGVIAQFGYDGLLLATLLAGIILVAAGSVRAGRSGAELLAQGAANIVSPLFGGLPATGAIARTATNVRAGGRTPAAGIVHAVTILIIMLAAASLAGYLAMPALAGLLIVTAWLMSEPGRWPKRMRLRAGDRALFFMTMILTVVSNLTIAIAVGTGAGLALRLLRRDVEPAEWTPADRSKL
jgi:sulfate permease, SulP family